MDEGDFSKYEEKLGIEKCSSARAPELGSESTGEIGAARFHKLFADGTSGIMISADDVFSNLRNILSLIWRKDKYEDGHTYQSGINPVPGFTEVATIPSIKPLLSLCHIIWLQLLS
jgi:hypothetical protein